MGRIVSLDQNMINMIAAGEVIERPASVVKELMENSIDAGATKIDVTVEDGGRKLICVTDNGGGMDAGDLALAFESHATSKIKTSADLHTISTLGFRGEALASIASISQVKAISRTKDSLAANCIEIDCGSKGDVNPCSGDFGTTMQVRDIFYKLPARRKFLKTANTEIGHITEQFIRIALANSNLDMTLSHNGREIYRVNGKEGLKQRISELFSDEIAENLIETETDEKGLRILALLGKPDISKTSNNYQYIFLNGRYIRDKFISHAIREAYRGNLEPDRFPVVFMFVRMPFEDYDVNVHPTKIEVRFYNTNLLHSQILAALRSKLLSTNLDVYARLPAEQNQTAGNETSRKEITDAMGEFFKKYRTGTSQQRFNFPPTSRHTTYSPISEKIAPFVISQASDDRKFLQIHDSFIVTESEEGFAIIDQHALHERIMYENLCKRIKNGNLESQRLLLPASFELTEAQAELLQKNAELLEKLGIEIVPFGPKTMAIQAFPMILAKTDPVDFIRDLMDLLADKNLTVEADRLLEEILDMAACKAAIKAGQKLTDNEIEQLLADRHIVECASRCPHGRPTTIKFSITELEKQFKRT
jgi:DNA mismatch repair protein MutL